MSSDLRLIEIDLKIFFFINEIQNEEIKGLRGLIKEDLYEEIIFFVHNLWSK